MKIKWLIILTLALIALIIVSLSFGRGNNKILTPAAKDDNVAEQPVVLPVEAPALVTLPSPAQPVKRAITIIKAPEQNEEAKTENAQDLAQSSPSQGSSSNPSSVSVTAAPEEPKAGITKVGKEAPPEVIKGIKSKGIIIL